jgi:hypothetical protein
MTPHLMQRIHLERAHLTQESIAAHPAATKLQLRVATLSRHKIIGNTTQPMVKSSGSCLSIQFSSSDRQA